MAQPLVIVAVAAVVGVGWIASGRHSATALLIAVAVVQAALITCWFLGAAAPGRVGGAVIGVAAAAAADAAAAAWPGGQLGVLLAVLGLAVPVMFGHQLTRGASRVQLVASLSATALLIVCVLAPVALPQLRHQLTISRNGSGVITAVVLIVAAAVIVAAVVDALVPALRLDPDIRHGLPGVLCGGAAGAVTGYLALRSVPHFGGSGAALRGAYLGAALGLLSTLLSVAGAMLGLPAEVRQASRIGSGARAILLALVPLLLQAPVAFVLALALRT